MNKRFIHNTFSFIFTIIITVALGDYLFAPLWELCNQYSSHVFIELLFVNISNPLNLLISIAVLVLLISAGYIKFLGLYKKVIMTPWGFKNWLHGILVGFPIMLGIIVFNNIHYLQSAKYFNGDYIVFSAFVFSIILALQKNYCRIFNKEVCENNDEDEFIDYSQIVDELYQNIKLSFKNNGGTIGLYGVNGIGKTYTLKLLEEKIPELKDNILVSKFDPFNYSNEVEMVKNFHLSILKRISENYLLPGFNSLTDDFLKIIYGTTAKFPSFNFNLSSIFDKYGLSKKGIESHRQIVEDYLSSMNIKILVIVDDIDRCSMKKRYALFQALEVLRAIKNVTIIISASSEELFQQKDTTPISIIE
ncbi:MAG: KAP family NTPase [Fibrobacterales bacterium]